MARRGAQAVLLDLDPAYALQRRLRAAVDRVVAVPPLPRYACPVERAAAAMRAIAQRVPVPALVFLGSGDYHYLTALLIERVRVPFTLILVDRHADESEGWWGRGFLSCGGWLRQARRWPFLRRVVRVDRGPLPDARLLLAELAAPAVYVSVDKDALRPEDACTGWGTGSIALRDLLRWLAALGAGVQWVGMDVCGEVVPALPGCPTPRERAALLRNERANLALLGLWRFLAAPARSPRMPGGRSAA